MNDNWLSRVGHCASLSWLHVVEGKLYVSQKEECLLCGQEDRLGIVSWKNTTWAGEYLSLNTSGKDWKYMKVQRRRNSEPRIYWGKYPEIEGRKSPLPFEQKKTRKKLRLIQKSVHLGVAKSSELVISMLQIK